MKRSFCLLVVLAAVVLACAASDATVRLEWRPGYQVAHIGDTVKASLYAVSESGSDQAIAGLDAIVLFDPAMLEFQSLSTEGEGYDWLLDGFMSPSPDDINMALDDGDTLYTAWARLGVPAIVPASGLRVTTFIFVASAPVCRTVVSMPEQFGSRAITRVMDGTLPNLDIRGSLGTARIMVVQPGILTSVAEAKTKADGTFVEVGGPIVTRTFGTESYFYIEDYDRSAGIRIDCEPGQVAAEGTTPIIQGFMRTIGGERVLEAQSVGDVTGCLDEAPPKPYAMIVRSATEGLIPEGLLITTFGRATSVGTDSFVLDDGSPTGLTVRLYGATAPTPGSMYVVTGALGRDVSVPVLRVNDDDDLRLGSP